MTHTTNVSPLCISISFYFYIVWDFNYFYSVCILCLLSPWCAATGGRGLGGDGWGRGLGRVWGRGGGGGGRLGAGEYDGENGGQNPPGHGHWLDVRNLVTVLVDAHDDVHGLTAVLVLHGHGVLPRVLHGHTLYGEAGELAGLEGDAVLVVGLHFLVVLRPADLRLGVTAH